MKEISDVTACVCDHRGLFLDVAHRLAQDCKRVLHWSNYEDGFSSVRNAIIGDGFSDIEWCKDPWKAKHDVDMFVFPDVEMSGMQLELASQGIPVWGVRCADEIELDRERFLGILKRHDLDVPKYEIVKGLTALRVYLKDKENKWVKISKWRGDMETFHWRKQKIDEDILDNLAVQFGPTKELHRFLVFDNIDTDLEIGGDTYFSAGTWPNVMINGTEAKSKAYFGIVTEFRDMPQQTQEVLNTFQEELTKEDYSGQFSAEIRVAGSNSFFNDACCRGGLPSTASQLRLWKNFSEIVWCGANGCIIDPDWDEEFAAECRVKCDPEKDGWRVLEVPSELKPWIGFQQTCEIDGALCFPPDEKRRERVGWLCALGHSPKETFENMVKYVSLLPDGVTAEITDLADIVKEIESAEDQGVPMTDKPMPEPSTVLET